MYFLILNSKFKPANLTVVAYNNKGSDDDEYGGGDHGTI